MGEGWGGTWEKSGVECRAEGGVTREFASTEIIHIRQSVCQSSLVAHGLTYRTSITWH